MNPIKIVIPGNHVDSQLHKERLYLWGEDGSVSTFSLPLLVKSFATDESDRLLTNAFLKGGSLYPLTSWDLRQDIEVSNFLRAKFEAAAATAYVLDETRLSASLIARQQSPSPFPHADSIIYGKALYTVGTQGLHRTAVSTRAKLPLSPHVTKEWDGRATGIDAGWRSLGLAAGYDGLWELTNRSYLAGPTQVSPEHASSCEFAFQSIFAPSHVNGGYLAEFEMLPSPPGEERERRFSRILPAKSIFRNTNLTFAWACREKICAVTDHNVLVKKYVPWSGNERIATLATIPFKSRGPIVSARTAVFGIVLERSDSMTILQSDGTRFDIHERPVFWRIFPRSHGYANQLHVGFRDRLEIHSFNHDYFVPQSNKLIGGQYGRISADDLPTNRSATTSLSAANDNATARPGGDNAVDAKHGSNQ